MKIKELIYQTPEMTEEKLLDIMNMYIPYISKDCKDRLCKLHNTWEFSSKVVLDEYDNIQDKKSYLTKLQRDQICGLVSLCLIKMTKGDGTSNN